MQEKIELPKNFFIGAAASAWQTEGWKGKKEFQDSYLDAWYKNNRNVWYQGYGPAIATDYIERYKEDISYMKKIGLDCYRTSLNWSRFLIDYEKAVVDEEYAAYYSSMLDELLNNGIEPMICLEHYEVPEYLMEKYGGWGSRHVVDLFVKYAERAFERFGKKVKYWFAFNEPIVVQTRAYLDALRWPYHQDSALWMKWNYHKALATAYVMKAYKESGYKTDETKLGTIINIEKVYSRSDSKKDIEAADKFDLFNNRIFMEPAIDGCYEDGFFELLEHHGIKPEMTSEDLEVIRNNTVDWVGINLYHPNRVKEKVLQVKEGASFHPDFYYDMFDLPGKRMNTSRGWEIYPKINYDFAMEMKNKYHNKEWFIAESGMGIMNEDQFRDENGMIQDDYRIDFIKENLYWTLKGAEAGSNVQGFMIWAFTDNVSPMNAFKNRYGLVEIDLNHDRDRKLKKSAYFYQQIIRDRYFEYHIDNEDK
jgi:beta-glucosidase